MERDLPVMGFPTQADLEAWLAENHGSSRGIWLKIAKKGAGVDSVTYPEAVEAALCYGWIDGRKDPLDGTHWLQRFTPRQVRSPWSKINATNAEALMAAGRMRPAGLREVERAKVDGRWQSAYAGQRDSMMPDDLQAALDASPAAQDMFGKLSGANRYAILYRVHDAKRPETRERRIREFVAMLERGETLHPQNPRPKARNPAADPAPPPPARRKDRGPRLSRLVVPLQPLLQQAEHRRLFRRKIVE